MPIGWREGVGHAHWEGKGGACPSGGVGETGRGVWHEWASRRGQ